MEITFHHVTLMLVCLPTPEAYETDESVKHFFTYLFATIAALFAKHFTNFDGNNSFCNCYFSRGINCCDGHAYFYRVYLNWLKTSYRFLRTFSLSSPNLSTSNIMLYMYKSHINVNL